MKEECLQPFKNSKPFGTILELQQEILLFDCDHPIDALLLKFSLPNHINKNKHFYSRLIPESSFRVLNIMVELLYSVVLLLSVAPVELEKDETF